LSAFSIVLTPSGSTRTWCSVSPGSAWRLGSPSPPGAARRQHGDRQHRDDAWTPIHYPNAVWDEAEQRLISDAEIAEVPFTAFTSRRTADHISGRLIVRRVKRLNPTAKTATSGAGGDRQGELFAHLDEHDHGYGITECVPSRQPPLWPTLRCIEIS
jgi:hypothetical protein